MGGGGARGLKPSPLGMISCRNYPSWSGAENCEKDQYTLIERSNTLIEQSKMLHKNVFQKGSLKTKIFFAYSGNRTTDLLLDRIGAPTISWCIKAILSCL